MKFISRLLRSSSSQNLPYSCVSDFEINRRGDHRSRVLQTRNFNRGPRKAKAFWGKEERNEVFIMNFKEIHSNTELLWTSHRFEPKISDWHKKTIWRALIRNKDTTKQSTGLFLPNLLLASFAKFGVSCHRFEPKYPIGTRKQYDGLS